MPTRDETPTPGAPRRGTEEELRRSEQFFRSVFDNAPIGILVLDPEVRIVQANRVICTTLGFGEDELVGRVATELLHPVDQPASRAMHARVLEGGIDEVAVERRALHKSGRVLWLQVRSHVQRGADGSIEQIISQLLDVTEQREQEEKLRESEERLRTIFTNAPIGMALVAPAGELLQVNRALATMLGRTPEDLQRMTAPELLHPEELERTRADIEAALAGERDVVAGENRYLHADGHIVWGAFQSSLVRDLDGTPRYFIAQVVDITERKAAEEALRDSEARYRELVELSQELIVRMDPAGNLTFVNDAWTKRFGLLRADVLGRSVMPRVLPVDRERAARAIQALREPPYRTRVELRQPTVDGLRWLEWEGSGILDGDGNVIEMQAIGRDVTNAHAAAEALRASEARYRGVVESQQAVVLRLDLHRHIVFVNDYGRRLLGIPRESVVGSDVLRWVFADDRETVRATVAKDLRPGRSAKVDCRVEVGGEPRWFEWETSAILDEQGTPVEYQSVGFDVTERRAAADALRASLEDLRQSEEKLRRLAQRQVAVREEERKRLSFDLHDGVCQELIGIGILVESVQRRLAAAALDPAPELGRVARYVSELVEHLRLLAGELRPMLLHDLGLEGSLRSLALGLATETTIIRTVFSTRVPRLEEAAEVTVYRIAQEALANALRHARAHVVTLTLATDLGRLRLEVRDDGCGFDPSRRRTSALGLLSMEERALALGGRLEVTSVPEEGTVVLLECPLVERVRASAA